MKRDPIILDKASGYCTFFVLLSPVKIEVPNFIPDVIFNGTVSGSPYFFSLFAPGHIYSKLTGNRSTNELYRTNYRLVYNSLTHIVE